MSTKTVNLTIHEGNYNRRVRYNEKTFSELVVNLTDGLRTRSFSIPASALPEADSIHLKYDLVSRKVSWSPMSINGAVKEI